MQEKSQEELYAVLQGWPETFLNKFGRKPTKSELINHLKKTYDEKIQAQLKSTFDSYGPKNLLDLIDEISNNSHDFIEHDLDFEMESFQGQATISPETHQDTKIFQKAPLDIDLYKGFIKGIEELRESQPVTQEIVKEPQKNEKKSKHKWMPNF